MENITNTVIEKIENITYGYVLTASLRQIETINIDVKSIKKNV